MIFDLKSFNFFWPLKKFETYFSDIFGIFVDFLKGVNFKCIIFGEFGSYCENLAPVEFNNFLSEFTQK